MKIGIFGINTGACAEPQTAAKVAVGAEQIGVESLWTAEHVVLPDPREAPSPADPETPFLHPDVVEKARVICRGRVKSVCCACKLIPRPGWRLFGDGRRRHSATTRIHTML